MAMLNEFVVIIDVLMTTETWYHSASAVMRMINYSAFFFNHESRLRRGLLLQVNNRFQCETLEAVSIITNNVKISNCQVSN